MAWQILCAMPPGKTADAAMTQMGRPEFMQVFECLQALGPALVVSSLGTQYLVTAEITSSGPTIIGRPGSGQVRVHDDCLGEDLTCQRTRAGGIFNGSPSIYEWYSAVRRDARERSG